MPNKMNKNKKLHDAVLVLAQKRGESDLSKQKSVLCKNAVLKVVVKDNTDINKIKYAVGNYGCLNERRHSSAYCQDCSDKNI